MADGIESLAVTLSTRLIKSLEGYEDVVYLDEAGYPTAGYGVRVPWPEGTKVSAAWIDSSLNERIMSTANWIVKAVPPKISLSSTQLAALISFGYNTGTLGTTIPAELRDNNLDLIPAAFRMWVYVTIKGVKRISQGLVNRRNQEILMWNGKWNG